MSGGISAIKGFDYQATVILDRLFKHFEQYESCAKARPEGLDDLDLSWTDGDTEHKQYIQIKKPAEYNSGELKPTPWTLSLIAKELLPNAIKHLSGNDHTQLWIVGDSVNDSVSSLINASDRAPVSATQEYWSVVHSLARSKTLSKICLETKVRSQIVSWKVPSMLSTEPEKAKSTLLSEFRELARSKVDKEEVSNLYAAQVTELHSSLPSVLARIEIQATYGSEQEVIQRVYDRLMERYSLQRAVIENALFRNLRGFINDISKQPGRSFNLEELEIELRCVWPQMIPIKNLPELSCDHVARRDLTERFTTGWAGKAIEAIGISGSGKTTLTAEIAERSRAVNPKRLIYYVEVRPDTSLRDVLTGVAFHLRRQGILEPFSIAVTNGPTEENALEYLAHSYSVMPRDILLLIDLVEGTCSTAFSRDLATFIRALSTSSIHIGVFGQESALREMTPLEREEYGVSRLDIRGFSFEEFVKLVSNYHPSSTPDWAALRGIYQKVTVGRASGLFAKLAQAIARAASIPDMLKIAAQPAEDMLAYAEQKRFNLISPGARNAAEKLVCFALPFLRKDAEEIFPDENIGNGIRELLAQGLLRYHDKDSFEMHETVRAGLEGMLAIGVRRSAHQALAAWYRAQGLITAEILHLEKAGKFVEAKEQSRELFLRGEQWSAVSAYVIRHKLLSAKDVIGVISTPQTVEHVYLLTSIIKELGEPVPASNLFGVIREQPQRYFSDYQWSSAIIETILELAPEQLHNLIAFSINNAVDEDQIESALGRLDVAMLRKGCVINSDTLKLFKSCPPNIKGMLVKILLRDRRREALRAAFHFISTHQESNNTGKNCSTRDFNLYIDSLHDTVEFLAAMPRVKLSSMLISKSALLGPLTKGVWSSRANLRTHCIEVLREGHHEEGVIENAIRILVFLAEPSLFHLCESFANRKDSIRAFSALLPVLQPAFFDSSKYQAQLFDHNTTIEDRFTALSILAYAGEDLGNIYKRLKVVEIDIKEKKAWDFLFLMLCHQKPFIEAIELLEEHMASMDSKGIHLAIPALMKLGELSYSEVTTMLAEALTNSNPEIRQSAALSLSRRRSRIALSALLEAYAKEDQETLAVGIATAIVASGAKSALVLRGRLKSPAIQLWQCILTMRLGDVDNADELIRIAIDPLLNWQLRRSAIFAAGRLPYSVALERIVPVIMGESSPLKIDHSENLACHSLISFVLTDSQMGWCRIFARGRDSFIDFFSGLFDEVWNDSWNQEGLPSGSAAAGWLYDRLSIHGWPESREAPERVLNEVNIPLLQSATLRSLRLCGQPELIEQQLVSAEHIWIAMKCLMERRRAGDVDTEHLRVLVDASPYQGDGLLHRVIDNMSDRRVTVQQEKPSTAPEYKRTRSETCITYDDAVRALSGTIANFESSAPLVLDNISSEQCKQLIRLSDPVNDHREGVETYIPMIKFTSSGHVVAQHQWTTKGSSKSPHAFLRPAVAAANSFGLPIPWLNKLMTERWSKDFVRKYLVCLCAMNNSSRFYEELSKYEYVMIEVLYEPSVYAYVQKHIDERIAPTLMRYVASGTDELFEGLCILALQVDCPEIDPVLSGLLYRWSQRFDKTSTGSQHDVNPSLWRGFRRLTEHSRFTNITDWMSLLEQVLMSPIRWFHAQDIVRVLERDPRSYVLIESRLFKSENWEHFNVEEIDRLDDAADSLFMRLLEE
ncbi:TPA: hypothetical protein L3N00_004161 [Vibrio parahaemolyticus]|uniref:HEAT repeat domain-containing protein n=1 Tax=Vibrio parahaemolyticus TaxID=670 RepID=UPI00101F634F|nr:HEAT repeat domain-containing protein [Vibrio parahaemolyticus]WCM68825.1 hypothetical protein K0819_24805 [Vibrio parahaemolyticus]HAV1327627.1 hypothetical protein [Vibrio parahaemolyticus]HBN6271588.1 hypothetical protein [Vibrio parahaemolyticus]